MSNIDAVNALITAINFDRFAEIEAQHQPDAYFASFRGPTLNDSVSIADWHREFLRDYADCNYTELEYVEDGETVALRATIEAKNYQWRPFTQRVVEVLGLRDEGVADRRLYGMLADVELDKVATASMANATGFKGGSASTTKTAIKGFYAALLAGNLDEAKGFLHEKAALVDSVYGITVGPDNMVDLLSRIPKPLFGYWRVTDVFAGAKDGVAELAIEPRRPRRADWVRMVDGKIAIIETYWMLREIGVDAMIDKQGERFIKAVILPI